MNINAHPVNKNEQQGGSESSEDLSTSATISKPTPHDYLNAILPVYTRELATASNYETKQSINKRVISKLIEALQVPMELYENNTHLLKIAPTVFKYLEEYYNQLVKSDTKCDMLSLYFSAFQTTDVHEIARVKSMIKEFVKLIEINKDYNNLSKKEKILRDNYLCFVLAVDGFYGTGNSDIVNYVDNLSVDISNSSNLSLSTIRDIHVTAVRKLYTELPDIITGTNALKLVFVVLLELYSDFVKKDENTTIFIDKLKETNHEYLTAQSNYYREISDLLKPEYQEKLKTSYLEIVQNDLETIALDKINSLKNNLKKRSNNGASSSKQPSAKKQKVSSSVESFEDEEGEEVEGEKVEGKKTEGKKTKEELKQLKKMKRKEDRKQKKEQKEQKEQKEKEDKEDKE